ncbi:SRPBCC family protein [Halocynthiibacter namhaensis]|uniref:SRPBCC family protein n=1 Tax=Halocynthiibacter namhaensis TaxID=1290553 RepID=UPI001EE22BA2|nr:SRPBCC family protein [Halocynthiibacter namhaensis]
MIHLQRSAEIKATPEAVWAELSRFMHIDEFAPEVVKTEALSDAQSGLGAKRRCHFKNNTAMAEEVVKWEDGKMYRVQLSELDAMPLHEAAAEIMVEPAGIGHSRVVWSFDFRVKYGPLGWLLGQTLMKMMMGKIIDGNLKGLAGKVTTA